MYAVCNSKMYYSSNLEVHVGKQPEGPFGVDKNAVLLVQRLCRPIHETRRKVAIDNFFTGVELPETLLKDLNLTIVGTM